MSNTPKNSKKRSWTRGEDQKLTDYISQGRKKESWNTVARNSGLNRSGVSCRLRYVNYLGPDIKRGDFSEDEVHKIIELQSKHGNRWSKIAAELPGRTDNDIKNYWTTHLKKTHPMANDSKTHKPRTDPNDLMNLITTCENGFGSQADSSHDLAVVIDQLQHQADQHLAWHTRISILIKLLKALYNPSMPPLETPKDDEASEPQWEKMTSLLPPLPTLRKWNYPLKGTVLPQDPSNSVQIANSMANIEFEGGPNAGTPMDDEYFLEKLLLETTLLPPPPPPPPPLREWNHPLMAHLDTETVLPQDPGNSMQIANSMANIEFEGVPNAEVHFSENPSMPQLVSAAPSLDDPNQSYLGTLMDDENREKLLEEWNHPLMAHLDTGNSSASGPWQLNADCKFNGKKTPLMSHLNSGIFLPQYPSISQEIANSRTNIRFEGGLSTEVNLSVNSAENPLLPHLNPGIFLLQNPNISHEIANSRINIGFEGIFLPQDPSISVEIANSRTNIGSEGGLSAEVNYLRENPLMPDLLVSAAPSLDHPNQNYLGTPIDDDWEIIFYETPSPPLLPSSE